MTEINSNLVSRSLFNRCMRIALNNGHQYHIVAVLRRGKSVIRIGTNRLKTDPTFPRRYGNHVDYGLHAELDVLKYSYPGDELIVLRFLESGDLTMAKPCDHCQSYICLYGIRNVKFSNWSGEISRM